MLSVSFKYLYNPISAMVSLIFNRFICICVLMGFSVLSYGISIEDSLNILIAKTKISDTIRYKHLNELAYEFRYKKPRFSINLINKNEENCKKYAGETLLADYYETMADAYWQLGSYDSSIIHYEKSLIIFQKKKNPARISDMLGDIGYIWMEKGDFQKAMDLVIQALDLAKKLDDKYRQNVLQSYLAVIYEKIGDWERALKIHKEICAYFAILGNEYNESQSLNNIGLCFYNIDEFDSARVYYIKAKDKYKKIGNIKGEANLYLNLSGLEIDLGNYDLAMEYIQKGQILYDEIGDYYGKAMSLYKLGDLHFQRKEYKSAKENFLNALHLMEESKSWYRVKDAVLMISKSCFQLGEYKEGFQFQERYIQINDSLFGIETSKIINELNSKYESKLKESEIEKLHQQQELSNIEIENQNIQKIAFAGGFVLMLVLSFVIFRSLREKQKANKEISEKKAEADYQRELVEEKNQEIMDSITYAKRLQDAILPPQKLVKEYLSNSFILYKPKDIVAGDFYWMELALPQPLPTGGGQVLPFGEDLGGAILFAAADCTGHGVPGAMVSVVCSNALNRAVKEFGITEPGKILDKVTDLVIETFEKSEAEVKDGMDVSLVSLAYRTEKESEERKATIKWAGANNPLWVVRTNRSPSGVEVHGTKKVNPEPSGISAPPALPSGRLEMTTHESQSGTSMLRQAQQPNTSVTDSSHISHLPVRQAGLNSQYSLQEIKADKQPIGKYSDRSPFTTHTIELSEGDSIYIFTDGYADQFGGEKGKKFKSSKLKDLVLSIQNETMEKQKELINLAFESWKGKLEQIDDVCIIGVKI